MSHDLRYVGETMESLSQAGYERYKTSLLPPNTPCVVTIGTIGKLCLTREASFCNQAVNAIIVDQKRHDPLYVYYLMKLTVPRIKALSSGTASGRENVSKGVFEGIDVRVHSFPAQKKIAKILSAYDDLIENNIRRIQILEQIAQMIYREWFVNFQFPGHDKAENVKSKMSPIPRGWIASTVGELCEEVRRGVNPSEIPAETPYIGLEHMPRKSLALSVWGKAGEVQSTKLRFRRGEILFGKIRPYFHKVGVAPIDGVCSSDAIVIVPKAVEYFPTVLACVSSDDFVRQAAQTSQGTKMPRANWDVLSRYPVALPDKTLLDRFNALVSPTVELIKNLVLRNRCLSKSRDLLLPKLIFGEVSVERLESEAIAQNA
jgi:type I restriction enzyme, S subunit